MGALVSTAPIPLAPPQTHRVSAQLLKECKKERSHLKHAGAGPLSLCPSLRWSLPEARRRPWRKTQADWRRETASDQWAASVGGLAGGVGAGHPPGGQEGPRARSALRPLEK